MISLERVLFKINREHLYVKISPHKPETLEFPPSAPAGHYDHFLQGA